jgi:CelD/BcsL family acetyltransferase involved in cellulose biosynthesis
MARAFVARGWLEFWLLKLDGDPVAAQFAFRYRDTVFSLQEGFDPAYSTDSVGYALRAHAIRQFISEGVRRYDFLGGQSPIKQRWGARPGVYLSIRFARPSSRGNAYLRSTLRPGSLCFDDSV